MCCYRVSTKNIVEVRNKIFLERGLPRLKENGFVESPFSTSWFGRDDHGGYAYELVRLTETNQLEYLSVYIPRGNKWIQIYLNIFELSPPIKSLDQLKGLDGINYFLPPNSRKEFRLWGDGLGGIFHRIFYLLIIKPHKLGRFCTKWGFHRKVKKLGNRIEKDMRNIDYFVKLWHKHHKPNVVDWEGNVIEERPDGDTSGSS